jgi:hypothetical protein
MMPLKVTSVNSNSSIFSADEVEGVFYTSGKVPRCSPPLLFAAAWTGPLE